MTAHLRPSFADRLVDRPPVLLFYLAVHAALAVMFRVAPGSSKVHGLAVLAIGLVFCLRRRDPLNWVYLAGYLVAGEVLWKMTRGAILWEQGKYFVILTMALAIWRTRQAGNPLPLAQFGLLLPSSLITIMLLPFDVARDALSFNLSGPLCLCLAAYFLSTVVMTEREFCKLLLLMIGPLSGIAVLTIYNVATVPIKIEFTNRSNYFVTGGFGPNQVSAALGLGIVLGVLLVLTGKLPTLSRVFLGGVILLCMSQAALTLSRNGLYCGIGASVLAAPFLLGDRKARRRFLLAAPLVAGLFVLAVVPALDEVTEGGMSRRFEQTSSSGRDQILGGEMELWKRNVVFGVGPGVGRYVRGDMWEAAAHTEFSRLLAEHGLLGLASLLLYPAIALSAFLSADTRLGRATAVAGVAWAVSFMLVNAMRMAAPSLMFGLALLRIREQRVTMPWKAPERPRAVSVRPSFSTPGL